MPFMNSFAPRSLSSYPNSMQKRELYLEVLEVCPEGARNMYNV